jgi:hypothetical protein
MNMHRFLVFLLLVGPAFAQTPEERHDLQAAVSDSDLTNAAVAKMSGDQIHDVLRHHGDKEPPVVATVAVVATFSTMLLVCLAVLFTIYRIYRQRSETLRLMVEKGVPIPPELLSPKPRPEADLRRGLVLCGLGLGLGIFLFAVAEHGMWTLGLMPLLVGAGYLLTSRLTRNTVSAA